MSDINFLFCNHPLYPHRVTPDYEEEYQAAGLDHSCALFSYEDIVAGKLNLYGEEISGLTIYRGRMMKPEIYRKLYEALEQKEIYLINTPEEYERFNQNGNHEQSSMPLSESYRVFMYAGIILMIEDYWSKKIETDIPVEEYKWLESIASKMKRNFVAVDVARKEDGTLAIMEIGDGQVAGLRQFKADVFYRTFQGFDVYNPYTIEQVKQILTMYTKLDIEIEMSLLFRDRTSQYMIINYTGHLSFMRCGYENGSEEYNYPDIETLFNEQLIDGICLSRDWYKVTAIWCEPDIRDRDDVIETYRQAAENRQEKLGDRYRIYQIVKEELDKWNPYGLLPGAPRDEFRGECENIARRVKFSSSLEAIARAIARAFSEEFEVYFTVEECMEVATNIKAVLDKEIR